MHPVDLSQYAPNAIPLHRVFNTAAWRKADLQRNIVAKLRSGNGAVDDAHASVRLCRRVGPGSVEQRPDEPAAFEAMRARKRQTPIRVIPVG